MPKYVPLKSFTHNLSQRVDYINLLDVIQRQLEKMFNVDHGERRLRIENINPGEVNKKLSLPEQMEAKYNNTDFATPVRADFVLYDKDGNEIERIKDRLIMHLPLPTDRGTYILGGREYSIKHQLRLKPGIYTTKVEDGVQAFINTSTRQNMKIRFNPDTSIFSVHIGARKFPLMPILQMLGIEDNQLKQVWGHEIFDANQVGEKSKETVMNNLYSTMYAFTGSKRVTPEERDQLIKDALAASGVDPWTTKVTVGHEENHLSPQLLFETTRKMLDVSAGRKEPDRRDALYFKVPLGIDDMVDIALTKQQPTVIRKLTNRLKDPQKDLISIINRPLITFGGTVRIKFLLDELSSTPEQTNPFDIWAANNEFTLLGEGGIPSLHAVTKDVQSVDDTYLGFIDPIQSPTGARIGINMYLSRNATKDGQALKAQVFDRTTNKYIPITPEEMYDKTVALPGSFIIKGGKALPTGTIVPALVKGEIKDVPASKIDVVLPNPEAQVDFVTNLIPMLNHNAGTRATYTTNQLKQALPLKYREAPLVESHLGPVGAMDNDTAEADMYELINLQVPSGLPEAVVTEVHDDHIRFRAPDGRTGSLRFYRDFPLNSNTFLDSRPTVKVGDTIKAGQIYAENNFSKDGKLAFGVNMKVGYIPWKGINYMDGLVISESAANRLTSEHIHQAEHSVTTEDTLSKSKFLAHYPGLYNNRQLSKLDADGVIREGELVEPGDPLMLKLTRRALTEDDILRGNISSVFKNPMSKNEAAWEKQFPGRVIKVVRGDGFVKVFVKTEEPAVVGDKITSRAGSKGVIVEIVPDAQMPHNEAGEPLEIIQNPAAVPSRMNLEQILEVAASKIARKRGEPYKAPSFSGKIDAKMLKDELAKAGLSDTEMLYDEAGNPIGPVMTGYLYTTKQKQQATKGYQARSREDPYELASQRPHKGPKMDVLGLYAMLSHGAHNLLKETGTFKSEWNDDYWRSLEMGLAPPAPKTTFAYNQLINMFKAAGINVREEGEDLRLIPMTDEETERLSNGPVPDPGKVARIGDPRSVDFLAPQEGGLYDRSVFGGLMGKKWGHIQLADGFPNPIFEDAIRSLLDLTQKQYMDLVTARAGVDPNTNEIVPPAPGIVIGGNALGLLLSAVNRDKTTNELLSTVKGMRGDKRDRAVRKLKYLMGLKKADMQPIDYMINKIPVLPPQFRPIYMTKDGRLRVSDLTVFYQNLGRNNNSLSDVRGMPLRMINNLREDTYHAIAQLQGIERAATNQPRQAKGILEYLKGDSPPMGYFQNKMLSKRQALGGRGVIMVDPKLDTDEIKLPEDMSWTIYKPFVIRRLVQQGISPLRAREMVDERHQLASDMLDMEMADRPVILSRDPKLHKFSYLSFTPRRYEGKAIYIPPLVVRGFNADFDGDTMSVTVPVTPEAAKEARERLRPSQNLIQYGRDSVIMHPEEDSIAGLYRGSMAGRDTGMSYDNPDNILTDYESGELKLDDVVNLNGVPTTPGRVQINAVLPEGLRDYSRSWGNKDLIEVLNRVAETQPNDYKTIVQDLKNLGDRMGYQTALSFSLDDFIPVTDKHELKGMTVTGAPPKNYEKIRESILERLKGETDKRSTLGIFANAGAKGSWDNILQILYSPLYVVDAAGQPYPHLITTGYAEGMNFPDYWTATKGSRVSEIGKSIEVRDPGYFGKQLIRAALGMTVQPGRPPAEDIEGIDYSVDHPTVLYRYLAGDVVAPSGELLAKAGQPITQELVVAAQKAGVKMFSVRSPLTTKAIDGLYAEDFGRLPDKGKPDIGTNVGAISAQTLSEPATQLVLKSFHQAGAAGASKKITGLYTIWPLLNGRAPTGQKAAMAPKDGKVKSIATLKSGAKIIYMDDGTEIHATPGLSLYVSPGDVIRRGQQLQDGYLDPRELLEYRGVRDLQRYLVDQVVDAYGKSAPDQRYVETLVSAITRYAEVEDPGDSEELMYGDMMATNKLLDYNKKLLKQGLKPIKFRPLFVGMDQQLPMIEPDWAMKMLGGDMVRQLRRAAGLGLTSRRRSPKPIMPYLFGINFGNTLEETGEY